MITKMLALRTGLALAAGLVAASSGAVAEGELGSLVCQRIAGTGINLLFHSSAQVRCVFKGSEGAEQWYVGKTGIALGLDLKWNKSETIYLGVLSSTSAFAPEGDFLSGDYAGAKADVSFGIGVGAAILAGGSRSTVALQPAGETSTGVGVAAGLSYLNLDPDPLNLARMAVPAGGTFALALYAGYFELALGYYRQAAYEGSDHFSGRAIAATAKNPPHPQALTKWKLPAAQRGAARMARDEVLAALVIARDIGGVAPVHAAGAQIGFDCWLYAVSHAGQGGQAAACKSAMDGRIAAVATALAAWEIRQAELLALAAEAERMELLVAVEEILMAESWFTLFFATDRSDLDTPSSLAVNDIIQRSIQVTGARVYIVGNTDRAGANAYNLALSLKRAESVAAALIARGVPADWIVMEAFGDTNPVSFSSNPHDALNRRVDVVFAPLGIKPPVIEEEAMRIAEGRG